MNIGKKIYNGATAMLPIKLIGNSASQDKQNFLVIKEFTPSTIPSTFDIDDAIFSKNNQTRLIFSPGGSLYFVVLDKNNKPMLDNQKNKLFKNPMSPNEKYEDNYLNWKIIDHTLYTKYNPDIVFPQYFVSLPSNLGQNAIGSGYILFRNTEYPLDGNYYILYNPFDRNINNLLPIENEPELFATYCQNIQFQDPACYCVEDQYHRCVYAASNGKTAGDVILNIQNRNNPENLMSLNTFIENCGCNTVCRSWPGSKTIPSAKCATNINNVICAVGISSADQSTITSAGINTTLNCGNNDQKSKTSPQSAKASDTSFSKTTIFIAAIIILIACISLFFVLRK